MFVIFLLLGLTLFITYFVVFGIFMNGEFYSRKLFIKCLIPFYGTWLGIKYLCRMAKDEIKERYEAMGE